MDQLQRFRSRPALVIATCGALVAGVAGADAARAATVIDLVATAPATTTIDLGGPGKTPGDLYAFTVDLVDGAGAPVGRLLGTQTSIALGANAESVLGALTFDLPDGQIAAGGTTSFPVAGTGLLPGVAFARPVLGGTGRYAGMRGTVTSTRRADGSYAQHLVLAPAATSGARTIDLFGGGGASSLDEPPSGTSLGDERVVDAPLADAAGHRVGVVRGTQTLVDVDADAQLAQAQLTFTTTSGTLVVGGLSTLTGASGADGVVAGTPQTRPVLGGTGRYAGFSGTVTTTNEAGRYRNHFALRPGTGLSKAQTVQAIAANGAPADLDLGPAGISTGDLYVFSGTFSSPLGKPLGILRGTQTVVALRAAELTMSSTISYDVRGRGQIVIGGLAPYAPAAPDGAVRLRRIDRAVLGGTGDFAGAHGTMRAVRRADGSYRLTFSLLGAPSRKR